MQILSRKTLRDFWEAHPASKIPLVLWFKRVETASWNSPADIKDTFGATVDFVADNRVIFDIGGNKFRLVAHIAYPFKRVLIKFVGAHKDYDKIDPRSV